MRALFVLSVSLIVAACGAPKIHAVIQNGESCTSSEVCVSSVCVDGICRPSCGQVASCPQGTMCSGGGCVPVPPIVCGDGVIQGTEACDDGNMHDSDGCSATCQLETGFVCSGQPTVCITCTDADPLNCTSTFAYSSWSNWTTCNAACGSGTQDRTRTCLRSDGMTADCAKCGGTCSESQACMIAACPPAYTVWSDWSTCTGGMQTHTRTCKDSTGAILDCSVCGGNCSESQTCFTCPQLSPNVVNCSPNVPGDGAACTMALRMGQARCVANGCIWTGPMACTIGGSVSNTMCYGATDTCADP